MNEDMNKAICDRNSYLPILCLRHFRLTFGSWSIGCRSILGSGDIWFLELDVFIEDGKCLCDFFTQFLFIIDPDFVSPPFFLKNLTLNMSLQGNQLQVIHFEKHAGHLAS